MPYFKVDDMLHSHPKPRRAGLEAMGLWSLAGSHCMAYKLDGFVPTYFVAAWPRGPKLAAQLVSAGLWSLGERDGQPGWQFHDWDDVQMTAAEIELDREHSRQRQRRYRDKMRQARAGTDDSQ
jgi:hypothetical protein